MGSLGSILGIIILWLVGFSLKMEILVSWSKKWLWSIQAQERLQYFSLMHHFFIRLDLFLVIVGSSFILVRSKKMISIGISISFLHIIRCDVLHPCLYKPILISGIVNLIVELFHVLKLRMLAEYMIVYTNFCLPPARKALLCIERSFFSFW